MNTLSFTTNSTESLGAPEQSADRSASSDPVVEILTAIRALGDRLGILEQRLEQLDRNVLKAISSPSGRMPAVWPAALDTGQPPERPVPLAMLNDGRVALCVTCIEGADLSEYERWEGIILPFEQAENMMSGLREAVDELAAHVGGSIRWRRRA